MKKCYIIILIAFGLHSCRNETESMKNLFLVNEIPGNIPIEFKVPHISNQKLIHKGIFSPDFREYYYTISNKQFEQFDVYVVKKINKNWSKPQKAFFNSKYNEHGMSFSPDGKTLYFSSTRPTSKDGIPETWHIWKSNKVNGKWGEPVFVDIPNMRSKLISHPTVTSSGTMYFHASNLDYSEMDIYYSKLIDGKFENAEKVSISSDLKNGKCTPYISPLEDYLIFASISNQLELMISYNDGSGNWVNTKALNEKINNLGQGNPYVTPDNKFLFYTTGDYSGEKWQVKWVNIELELEKTRTK